MPSVPTTTTTPEDGLDRTAAERFRECMGRFTTGVTVVLAEGPDAPAGMTVNSFASVSLEPLLVLVSLKQRSHTLATVRASGRFTISMLGQGQEPVARAFGRPKERFPREHISRYVDGHVYVRDALAWLRCRTHSLIGLGDHDVVVGEVEDFWIGTGEPLVFHSGSFVELGREQASAPR
jgi:flavin reductase (DIM6/NTAB) family NADH-FMN oxidoreductase RutF